MTVYSAVVTTGVYCRPGCGARPLADNVRTFDLAASAEAAGFRACLRCRPYRMVGSVPWDAPELVCRAVRLIIDGALDDGGTEAALAARLGWSGRHLRRMFLEHLGLTPDQLARSRRTHFARRLLDDTDLAVADVAFASGFGSLRQFNRAMRETFRDTPNGLRGRRRRADRLVTDGGLAIRLGFTPPYDWDAMLASLDARRVPGVESVDIAERCYRRVIMLDGDPGVLEVRPGGDDHLLLVAHLPYWEGLIHVVERIRHALGLDADPEALPHLGSDLLLSPLLRARPGLRVAGAWAPFEVGVRAAIRVRCGREETTEQLARLVKEHGVEVPGLPHGLSHAFPSPEVLAEAGLEVEGPFAQAVASGQIRLDGSMALEDLAAAVEAVPGFDRTAARHLAMRLGERDAFPDGDPLVRRALNKLDPALTDIRKAADAWRPWRALAAQHLIAHARTLPGQPRDAEQPSAAA
ncbi:DNA-3-methyladenine glycosylase 2 [Catenulispora subtropica]|uniref:DNA-3-methyladenine glycosylase 2 n=1 Tax=Catenulispora subtropica TaxID=450798 RepID=A0ABP5CCW9_9ACTN